MTTMTVNFLMMMMTGIFNISFATLQLKLFLFPSSLLTTLITHIFSTDSTYSMANRYLFILSSLILLSHPFTFPVFSQTIIYNPIPLQENQLIRDRLTPNDIPTGEGGFARDYTVNLEKGDQIAVDLMSDNFDTVVTLIGEDGTTIAENDDAPDSDSNSLLFTRIAETGKYIIRVKAFGATGNGDFTLKLTKLKPIP